MLKKRQYRLHHIIKDFIANSLGDSSLDNKIYVFDDLCIMITEVRIIKNNTLIKKNIIYKKASFCFQIQIIHKV